MRSTLQIDEQTTHPKREGNHHLGTGLARTETCPGVVKASTSLLRLWILVVIMKTNIVTHALSLFSLIHRTEGHVEQYCLEESLGRGYE